MWGRAVNNRRFERGVEAALVVLEFMKLIWTCREGT